MSRLAFELPGALHFITILGRVAGSARRCPTRDSQGTGMPNGYQFAIGVRRADSLAELMGQCDFVSL